MIPRSRVLRRIADYKSRQHPEIPEYWQNTFMRYMLKDFAKYPSFTLEDVLNEFDTLYLCNNGFAHIGLEFDDVVAFLGLHPNPSGIPIREDSGYRSRDVRVSEYSFLSDQGPQINSQNTRYRFLEGFFGLSDRTFKSAAVEPAHGLRLDRRGQIGSLIERILDEGIPLFADKIETDSSRAYVVNGFEV